MMVSRIVMKMVMDPTYMEKSWSRTNCPTSLSSIPMYCPNRVFANPRLIRLLAGGGNCWWKSELKTDCSYSDNTADKQDGGDNKTELKYSLLNVVFVNILL